MFDDEDTSVVAQAIYAFSLIKDERTVPHLPEKLHDDRRPAYYINYAVYTWAAMVLKGYESPEVNDALEKAFLRWNDLE